MCEGAGGTGVTLIIIAPKSAGSDQYDMNEPEEMMQDEHGVLAPEHDMESDRGMQSEPTPPKRRFNHTRMIAPKRDIHTPRSL